MGHWDFVIECFTVRVSTYNIEKGRKPFHRNAGNVVIDDVTFSVYSMASYV